MWRYRYFLFMFVYRRIRTQYAGAVLGILWSLLNPLLTTLIFSVVRLFILPGQRIEAYPLFLLAGILPWNFFTNGLSATCTSILSEGNLVKKVPLPTELLVMGVTLTTLPNFLGGLLILFPLGLILGITPTKWVLLLPFVMLLETLFIVGLGLFLATANVFYRDVQAILRAILQAWFFATPIWYSIDHLPAEATLLGVHVDVHRWIRILNPMASFVDAYRDILYWGRPTDPAFLFRITVMVIVTLFLGHRFFLRYCDQFAEEL